MWSGQFFNLFFWDPMVLSYLILYYLKRRTLVRPPRSVRGSVGLVLDPIQFGSFIHKYCNVYKLKPLFICRIIILFILKSCYFLKIEKNNQKNLLLFL